MWHRRIVRQLRSRSSLRQQCGRGPVNAIYGSPQSCRHHKPAAEYWKMQPWGSSVTHPRPPGLQVLSLNVNGLRERQKRAALFAFLPAGPWHIIALQETHHIPRQRLPNGVERGQALPAHGTAHHHGLLANQPAVALLFKACPESQPMQTQTYCFSRHLEWQPCQHGVSVCFYSYQQRIFSQNDKWLVSDSLLSNVRAASVTDLILSDHYGVAVTVSPANAIPAPRATQSFGSMPPAVISHPAFKRLMTAQIRTFLQANPKNSTLSRASRWD